MRRVEVEKGGKKEQNIWYLSPQFDFKSEVRPTQHPRGCDGFHFILYFYRWEEGGDGATLSKGLLSAKDECVPAPLLSMTVDFIILHLYMPSESKTTSILLNKEERMSPLNIKFQAWEILLRFYLKSLKMYNLPILVS